MNISLSIFLLLSYISPFLFHITPSYADDCVHENYPGYGSLIYNATSIKSLDNGEEKEAINEVDIPLNSTYLQEKCLSKFPNPPYTCRRNEIESYTLNPEPKLKNMSEQGNFGSCYISAPLFSLEELINQGKDDANRIKYSHSDAICQANREIQLYRSGGFGPSALVNIAELGSLLLCKHEKISHETVVDNIYKSPSTLSDIEKFSKAYQSVQDSLKMSDGRTCERMKIPPFYINEIQLSKGKNIAKSLLKALSTNKTLIVLNLVDHETNLYGINSYSCTNNTNEAPLNIITYKIIDSNGYKLEIFSDDLEKGILKGNGTAFYLSLKNNSDTNLVYRGFLGLSVAVGTGNIQIVKRYLNKANINQVDSNGVSPLLMALQNAYKDITELLINNKANIDQADANGFTPLLHAIQLGDKDIVELLITNKANIDQTAHNGASPLLMAAQKGYKDIVELLINNKANIDQTRSDGASPLLMAAQKGHQDIVELLINNKAKINLAARNGASPLFMAAQMGHKNIVELLINNKANIDQERFDGANPLLMAALNGHKDIVELLIKAGANLNTEAVSKALILAKKNGHNEIVDMINQWKN